MPARDALVDHCLELLSSVGTPSAQRMFGGHGLRIDGLFIALIAFERLYLKADALTRPQFEAAGCEPFKPFGGDKAMSYWTVPLEALEDPDEMTAWTRRALDAALRAKAGKKKP